MPSNKSNEIACYILSMACGILGAHVLYGLVF